MYLYFDKQGILKTKIIHGEVPRQGAVLNIYTCLDLDFFNNNDYNDYHDWTLFIHVQNNSNNKDLIPTEQSSSFQIEQFHKVYTSEVTYNLVNGESYLTSFCSLPSNYTTDYGCPLRLSFKMHYNYPEDPSYEEYEETDQNTIVLASAVIEVEKTIDKPIQNIMPNQYAYLLDFINERMAWISAIQQSYVKNAAVSDGELSIVISQNGIDSTLVFSNLYEANYGTSTTNDIAEALIAKKIPYLIYGGRLYLYEAEQTDGYHFISTDYNVIYQIILHDDNWSEPSFITLENVANKTNALDTNQDHYPSNYLLSSIKAALDNAIEAIGDNYIVSAEIEDDELKLTYVEEGVQKTLTFQGGGMQSVSWGDILGTLSNQTDLKNALDAKQDTLVSGTNIKTINDVSVLGDGNIDTRELIFSPTNYLSDVTITYTDNTLGTIEAGAVIDDANYEIYLEIIED